jgi:hypothetical protein
MSQLFARSWHDVHRTRIRMAVREVENLDRSIFSDPRLGGILESIVARQNVEVAMLVREGVRVEARTEKRDVSDYGRTISKSFKVLDVFIPIAGNPETLSIYPSSYTLISTPYELRGAAIILRVADTDGADDAIDAFINQVNGNLSVLRREVARFEGQVKEAVEQAAQKRKEEIEADDRRDQNRRFPVTRRS